MNHVFVVTAFSTESHSSCQSFLCYNIYYHVWVLETNTPPEPLQAFVCY